MYLSQRNSGISVSLQEDVCPHPTRVSPFALSIVTKWHVNTVHADVNSCMALEALDDRLQQLLLPFWPNDGDIVNHNHIVETFVNLNGISAGRSNFRSALLSFIVSAPALSSAHFASMSLKSISESSTRAPWDPLAIGSGMLMLLFTVSVVSREEKQIKTQQQRQDERRQSASRSRRKEGHVRPLT